MGTPGYPVTVLSAASALGTPKHGTGTPDALHGTVPCTGTHKYPYHSAQRCSLHWGHPGTAVAPLVPRIAASPGDTDTLQHIMVLAPGTRRYLSHPLRGIIPCAGDTRVPLSLTPPHGAIPCTGDSQAQCGTGTSGPLPHGPAQPPAAPPARAQPIPEAIGAMQQRVPGVARAWQPWPSLAQLQGLRCCAVPSSMVPRLSC